MRHPYRFYLPIGHTIPLAKRPGAHIWSRLSCLRNAGGRDRQGHRPDTVERGDPFDGWRPDEGSGCILIAESRAGSWQGHTGHNIPFGCAQDRRGAQNRKILLFAVGFETTSPAIAATVKEARRREIHNLYLLSSQRLIPPAIKTLLSSGKANVDGLLLPGHVSVIIGKAPYSFIARDFSLMGVITGFEPLDILEGICMLLRQKAQGRSEIENQYRRAAKDQGNRLALQIMEEVFQPVIARWRGLGKIPDSGLTLREEFEDMDAAKAFDLPLEDKEDPPGCRCGEVLQGLKSPPDCPLFGKRCTPDDPIGPCMVSSEGSCGAFYTYGVLQ